MGRRNVDEDDSLGLLLDTISNAFGAVVFLALAIVVMLNQVPDLRDGAVDLQRAELRLELSRVRRELDNLEEVHRVQDADISSIEERLPGALSDVQQWTTVTARLQAEHEHLREAIRSTEETIAAGRERAESLVAEVAAAEHERDATRLALDDEMESRSTRARVSRVRGTHKAEVALMLRYGRLYVWHRYDASGVRLGLNTDEFIAVRDHGSHVETVPRPGAGIAVAAREARGHICRRLETFQPTRHYFAVVVWPDSFDDFQKVKRIMVESGFEYRLMPFTAGEQLFDRGGKGANVQ